MRVLPRTLGGRTLLLVVSTVLLSEAATFVVLERFRQGYVAQRGADTIVGYIRVIQSAVESMPSAARAQFATKAMTEDRVRVVAHADAHPPEHEPVSPVRREMAARIRGELGADTAVRTFVGGPAAPRELWVSFPAAGERWWLAVPSGRLEMPLPWALLGILGAVVAAAMLFGAGFIRSIVRPLRDLEDATGALGAGRPRSVTPAGPQETRVLAQRFNAMLDQLERNERERNVMLAGLPHDLRAPLTRLRLRIAMLDEETRAGIQRDAEDIDRIANQFIAYLRGAWGSQDRREWLALLPLVEERAAHYGNLGRRVTVRGDASVRLSADPEGLVRLLDNLIDNVLRYGAEPVEIAVDSTPGFARITLRDHGPGIPPDQVERARQPFARLEAARSGSGSCGLGLAIVDRIARAHQGRVMLGGAEGGGLSVEITLSSQRDEEYA